MDLKEAAEFLKVSKPTFYRWLAEGKVKGAKVGQQWRFQRQDLETFLQSDPNALPSEGEGFRAAVEADRAEAQAGAAVLAEERGRARAGFQASRRR